MSLTRTVLAAVPFVFQSSYPELPSSATKKRFAPAAVNRNSEGAPPAPGLMSLTRTVPAAVPSLFHSSKPKPPSVAWK
jgi:hypothetical protein